MFTLPSSKSFEKVMLSSYKLSKNNNSKFYFVYLPDSRFLLKNDYNDFKNYKKVIKTINDLEISIIDINKELFQKQEDLLSLFPFGGSGHYNEVGYRLIAKTIFNKIKELEEMD